MLKIAITAGSLNGNRGAEAMLVSTISRIRERLPEAQFGIYTPYFRDDTVLWNNPVGLSLFNLSPLYLGCILFPVSVIAGLVKKARFHYLKFLFPKSVRFMWECSVVIDIAGVSFIDTRISFIPFNILSIYGGFLLGIPVVKFAQAIGPFGNFITRVTARHCLNRCTHIFARGKTTLKHLTDLLPLQNNFSLSADIAFCHTPGDGFVNENRTRTEDIERRIAEQKSNGKTIIGISPSALLATGTHGKKYMKFLSDFIETFSSDTAFPVIFPTASKEHQNKTWRNNDLPLINQLREQAGCRSNNCFFVNFGITADLIKNLIRHFDLVLCSRFHAMVFSLSMHVPVFVIGWSHKYREVLRQFDMEHCIVDIAELQPADIEKRVGVLLHTAPEIKKTIQRTMPEVRQASYTQISRVISLVTSGSVTA